MIPILLVILVVLVLAVRLAWPKLRARRTPPELRGDWWPRFEQEFRAYAKQARSGHSRRERTQRREP